MSWNIKGENSKVDKFSNCSYWVVHEKGGKISFLIMIYPPYAIFMCSDTMLISMGWSVAVNSEIVTVLNEIGTKIKYYLFNFCELNLLYNWSGVQNMPECMKEILGRFWNFLLLEKGRKNSTVKLKHW